MKALHLVAARGPVAEAAATALGDLGLGDGNDVDGDGRVELERNKIHKSILEV